jgi:hypothetical protein
MAFDLRNPMILLGLCGAVTGVLNAILMALDVDETSRLFGVFFGLAIVAALRFLGPLPVWRGLVVLVAFGASWELAVQAAIQIDGWIEPLALVGVVAGALGAAIVALGFAVLFAGARAPFAFLRTVLIGAAAGALLQVDSPFVLLVIWQTAVAASLGHAIGAQESS